MGAMADELRDAGGAVLAMLELGQGQPVRMLLDSARQAVRESAWDSALYRCEVAADQAMRSGDTESHATALVCRAVVQLAMGDLDAAAATFQRAAQLFHLLGQPANEAVAALGYGYTSAARRQPGPALDGFQRARRLLRARATAEYRAGNNERARLYEHRARQVRELMDRVLASPVVAPAPARTALVVAPVVALEPGPAGGDAPESAQVLAREFTIGGRVYTLHRIGPRAYRPLELQAGGHYFAVAVPSAHWARLGVRRGDYVLLCREEPPEPEGYLVYRTAGGEVELGHYPEPEPRAPRVFREAGAEAPGLAEPAAADDEPVSSDALVSDPLIGYVVGVLKLEESED
jgi:hypothetical protein